MKNRELIKTMKRRGWVATTTANSHLRFVYEKTGEFLFHSGTPSDRRSIKNFLARAKRIEAGAEPQ